jgi:hypothetical protein
MNYRYRFIFLCWPHRRRIILYSTTVYRWEVLCPFALCMYLLNILSTLSLWNIFHVYLSSIPFILSILYPSSSRVRYEIKCFVKLNVVIEVPYILESNPHPFYSFRGLKNHMRIRFACGLDSRSRAGFWKNDWAAVRAVRTIQYNNLLFYYLLL